MNRWLPAAALLLAAAVGTYVLLHSSAGRTLVTHIASWEDKHHGLGEPCADRVPVAHTGPLGITMDLPRCFTVTASDEGGVAVETIADPGLGKGLTVRYIRRDGSDLWARAEDAFERRRLSPMSNASQIGEWRIVSTASQRPGSKAPNTYYEWAIVGNDGAVLAALEVHKFYAQSPKILALVSDIDRAMHSIRSGDPSTGGVR
jgi:hypothetical protein